MFLILNNIISLLRVKYTKYFITFVNNQVPGGLGILERKEIQHTIYEPLN